MPTALSVQNLWKSYSAGVRGCSVRVWALRGCSLDVEYGERVAIVGPRGAGKTTLLHCLAGARRADAGHVRSTLPQRRYFTATTLRNPLAVMALPSGVLVLVDSDDDGSLPTPAFISLPTSGALVIASRDVARVRNVVDRIVLIRDGRLAPMDRIPVRRVAERNAPRAPVLTSDMRESSTPGTGHALPACTLGP